MARIAIALMAAALAAGCASKREASAPLVSIPPAQVTTRIVGATPKQRGVLLKILAGLGPTSLEAIEVVKAAKIYRAPADIRRGRKDTTRAFAVSSYSGLDGWHSSWSSKPTIQPPSCWKVSTIQSSRWRSCVVKDTTADSSRFSMEMAARS